MTGRQQSKRDSGEAWDPNMDAWQKCGREIQWPLLADATLDLGTSQSHSLDFSVTFPQSVKIRAQLSSRGEPTSQDHREALPKVQHRTESFFFLFQNNIFAKNLLRVSGNRNRIEAACYFFIFCGGGGHDSHTRRIGFRTSGRRYAGSSGSKTTVGSG